MEYVARVFDAMGRQLLATPFSADTEVHADTFAYVVCYSKTLNGCSYTVEKATRFDANFRQITENDTAASGVNESASTTETV